MLKLKLIKNYQRSTTTQTSVVDGQVFDKEVIDELAEGSAS